MTAASMILGLIESMIPFPFIAPGAKLGLTNIVTLAVLIVFGLKEALLVVTVRCLLLMLIAGNPVSLMYSAAGGITAAVVMYAVIKAAGRYLSLVGVSVLGAMAHNTAQVSVAAAMFDSPGVFMYLPVMSLISVFTGCFVGIASMFVVDTMKRNTYIQSQLR